MSMTSTSPTETGLTARDVATVERALVDASLRTPVLFLFGSALIWLVVATFFGSVASLKLIWPGFMDDCAWMTYGRVWPVFYNVLGYGWAVLAGLGVSLWIAARLARVSIKRPGWIVAGTHLWNLGITVGIIAILSGNGTGIEWMEFPKFVSVILFVAWLVVASWIVVLFKRHRPGHIYISFWYLVGAVVWFPWFYGTAHYLVSSGAVHGVMAPIVAAWFAGGFLNLVLAAIGLGIVYYIIPKVTGCAIHSYSLASLAFWSFALFAGWTGLVRLNGGPLPAWMVSVSIVAGIFMLVPVVTVTVNFALTMRDHFKMIYHSPAIRFSFFGALAYTVANVVMVVTSFRTVGKVTHLTEITAANDLMMIYAFFSMVVFGAMYYIIPRLVGCEWFSASLIRIHFWGAAYGMGMFILALFFGGVASGSAWFEPALDKLRAVEALYPYAVGRGISLLLLIPAHLAFGLHFLMMMLRMGRPGGLPTLFAPLEEEQ